MSRMPDYYMTDKVREMPHNEEAERSLLGAIFLEPRSWPRCAQAVTAGDFYREAHRHIWRTMGEVIDAKAGLDAVVMVDRLTDKGLIEGCGGPQYITRLTNAVPSAANAPHYADIVREKARMRELITGLESLLAKCHNADTTSTDAAHAAGDLVRAVADKTSRRDDDPKAVADALIEYCQSVFNDELTRTYGCGIRAIDELCEFELGMYYVLGAYSGHGKTTVSSAIAAGLAYHHDAVVSWWNCEVGQIKQCARVLTSQFSRDQTGRDTGLREHWVLHPNTVPHGSQEDFWAALTKAIVWFRESGVYIKPPGSIQIREVELTAEALRMEHPDRPLVVVVDYLQHCHTERGRAQSASERLSEVSGRLSNLAKELDCIVIALTQFTEENRPTHPIPMPNIQQVRHSKDIRNDADVFLAYHRPWAGAAHHSEVGILELGKDRYGVNAHVALTADGGSNTFEPYAREYPGGIEGLHSRRINTGWSR